MSKVLVVEDNKSLAKSLKDWLSKHYEVMLVGSGGPAIIEATQNQYGVIVLDLGLPDMTGQDVCQTIRDRGIKTPILILTATDKVSSRVSLLDSGADDYLLKPFYVGELQARLRALLRRDGAAVAAHSLKVGDLTLDISRRQVKRGGQIIELRRKEFDILEYLMRNHGTVVTRTMIINNSWEAGADRWNNTVDVHIKYIRDKIDRPFKHKLLKTAYGVGYMIDDA
ncbi:MAG: response regulator transcription factor [Candidatus Saccharimonadales bacterium]